MQALLLQAQTHVKQPFLTLNRTESTFQICLDGQVIQQFPDPSDYEWQIDWEAGSFVAGGREFKWKKRPALDKEILLLVAPLFKIDPAPCIPALYWKFKVYGDFVCLYHFGCLISMFSLERVHWKNGIFSANYSLLVDGILGDVMGSCIRVQITPKHRSLIELIYNAFHTKLNGITFDQMLLAAKLN